MLAHRDPGRVTPPPAGAAARPATPLYLARSDALLGWADPDPIAEIALPRANQALELDDANPHVHFALSHFYMSQRRSDHAIAAARRAGVAP